MKEYTIQSLEPGKKWSSGLGGPMQDYRVVLKDSTTGDIVDKWVTLSKKESSKPPQVGWKLTGDIVETDYGPKFKAAPFNGSPRSAEGSISNEKIDYIVQMLEELTGRRDTVVEPTDEELNNPTLDDPFGGRL